MRAAVICQEGLEKISKQEIKELIGKEGTIKNRVVEFNYEKPEELFRLCYRGQSFFRVMHLIGECECYTNLKKTAEEIKRCITREELDFLNGNSFKVICKRVGHQHYTSNDLAPLIGETIINIKKLEVDVKNPEKILYVLINNNRCYIGVDIAGYNLSKREYKIFNHPADISPVIAYSLVKIADYSAEDTLLDPFSYSSTIAIEGALFATKTPPNFYRKDSFAFRNFKQYKDFNFERFFEEEDKKILKIKTKIYSYDSILANVKASLKNAKIAGVNKNIEFSKVPVEWLDTKFQEGSVSKVISSLPSPSKHKPVKKIVKLYKELFYNLRYIMAKKGVFIALCREKETFIKEAEGFSIESSQLIRRGEQELHIIKLIKK